jgi:hypothetical protein
MILFEFVTIPILTILALGICLISISLIINAKNSIGLIGNSSVPSLIIYLSTAAEPNILVNTSYANRIIMISLDVDGAFKNANVQLFDASEVPQGTTVTIYNSAASPVTASVTIGALSTADKIAICLGRGQGVTLITQRQIPYPGVSYNDGALEFTAQIEQAQDIVWKPFINHPPEASRLCSDFNDGPSVTSTSQEGCIENYAKFPLTAGQDYLVVHNCLSAKCNCGNTNSSNSAWCNFLPPVPNPIINQNFVIE